MGGFWGLALSLAPEATELLKSEGLDWLVKAGLNLLVFLLSGVSRGSFWIESCSFFLLQLVRGGLKGKEGRKDGLSYLFWLSMRLISF